ncbi:right-handed parallel beta-helix repeat-containing protein [Priestia megaterium]
MATSKLYNKLSMKFQKGFLAFFLLMLLAIVGTFILKTHVFQQKEKIYNVKTDFSVKGDGIHDDTKNIQRAIDEVPKGSTIIFPKGVYTVSNILKYKVETGYGISYSALKINKPINIVLKDAIIQTNSSEEYGVFWVYKTSNVTIKGGKLIGKKFSEESRLTSRIGILIQDSKNCLLKNIYTRNFTQGINLYFSNKNKLENISTEYNRGSGIISFRSNRNLIKDCLIRNSSDGDLSLYGGGKDNKVFNCTIVEDRKNRKNEQGLTIESEKNSIIKNTIVTGFYYGIDIKNGSKNITVQNNRIFNNQFNIAVRAGDPNNLQTISNNIKIVNNNVLDIREEKPRGGIILNNGKNHIIEGNSINKNTLIIDSNIINNNKNLKNVKINSNTFIES